MFKGKKAYIHHPVVAIIVGFIVGMVIMFLMARGVIPNPMPINICP